MNIEDIITGKDNSIQAKTIRGILTPFSWLYELAHSVFFIPYRLGIRKKHKAPLPVISVGNITMGGTGKTPFVITLADMLKELGYSPIVISRGYGRKNTSAENLLFMPDSGLSSDETGDEPQVISEAVKVPIIVGRNRIKSLKLLNKDLGDIIILDDGMQYWQLYKDIEIAIASSRRPFGSGRTIPSGDLRESKKGLRRCRFIILTSNGKEENRENIDKVKKYCPNSFVFSGHTSPYKITYMDQTYDTDFLANKKIYAFSGIANPHRFLKTLEDMKAETEDFASFPDHYSYTEKDLCNLKEKAGNRLLVTTAKDSAKLPKDYPAATVHIYTETDSEFKNLIKEML